ncbi:egl1 [Symbiodinium natans]|uniref:Egl1 protein n=1 Tax=Symbiodinium natans TaxID=878477 RepID=A0A812PJQ3_9DINO|nr:egl1 [Symbiodinium natans]
MAEDLSDEAEACRGLGGSPRIPMEHQLPGAQRPPQDHRKVEPTLSILDTSCSACVRVRVSLPYTYPGPAAASAAPRGGEVVHVSTDGGQRHAETRTEGSSTEARPSGIRAKRARQAEKQEAAQAAASAMTKAAEASFRALEGADGSGITAEALRVALKRYRIPVEVCKPEEVEEMLAVGAEEAGEDPGPLNFFAFKTLFNSLNLKVTREGRVW